MRPILLAALALSAVATLPLAPAAAAPECEEPMDRPCPVLCVVIGPGWYRPVETRVPDAPPRPLC